jgi:hypothetical protein
MKDEILTLSEFYDRATPFKRTLGGQEYEFINVAYWYEGELKHGVVNLSASTPEDIEANVELQQYDEQEVVFVSYGLVDLYDVFMEAGQFCDGTLTHVDGVNPHPETWFSDSVGGHAKDGLMLFTCEVEILVSVYATDGDAAYDQAQKYLKKQSEELWEMGILHHVEVTRG